MTADPANVYELVQNMSRLELDALPFGAIRLDRDGTVLAYNRQEAQLSGIAAVDAIGKNFFTDVAPCTNVREFHGLFREGVQRGQLHEKFRFLFRFTTGERHVLITLYYQAKQDSIWVFVQTIQ
jgi:photoactive yellow protein